MSSRVRWGIISTGRIAHDFATALKALPDADLVAVGSRRMETAQAFADEFDIPHRHGRYADLVADQEVEIVYIGTPHAFHHRDALMALEAGKHVLVEKAFTLNAVQAREVVELARSKGLFAMEAMWTRHFPLIHRLRELLAQGAVGQLQMVRADLSHHAPFDPTHRLYDPLQGGGALLDLGVYPISFAFMVLGPPDRVMGVTHLGQSGVDDQSACLLGYEGGQMAVLSFSQRTDAPREALVCGTDGVIQIHGRWISPSRMTVRRGSEEQEIAMPFEGDGFQFEAAEVMECIRQGRMESQIMPLDETVQIMEVMDQLRQDWGLMYPNESGETNGAG